MRKGEMQAIACHVCMVGIRHGAESRRFLIRYGQFPDYEEHLTAAGVLASELPTIVVTVDDFLLMRGTSLMDAVASATVVAMREAGFWWAGRPTMVNVMGSER